MEEKLIGNITHYFTNIGVAVLEISVGQLNVGDKIHIKGTTNDFEQTVDSMQVEHENVKKAKKGDAIGLKVEQQVKEGDEVYKVE
ncbi:translation elongation factor-like protein [Patescibacteria group bacterium]|nr:translation elongation factor-like protein [Patescibacteria group bacterium]MBU1563801.1 translation elongation factor-like protein [Patescibacteria group bacterium]